MTHRKKEKKNLHRKYIKMWRKKNQVIQSNKISDKAVTRLSLLPEVTTEIRDPAPLLFGPHASCPITDEIHIEHGPALC